MACSKPRSTCGGSRGLVACPRSTGDGCAGCLTASVLRSTSSRGGRRFIAGAIRLNVRAGPDGLWIGIVLSEVSSGLSPIVFGFSTLSYGPLLRLGNPAAWTIYR